MVTGGPMGEKSFQFLNVLINEEESTSLNTRRDHYYDHIQSGKISVNLKFGNKSIDNFGLDLTDNVSLMELKHRISVKIHVHVQFIRVTVKGGMLPNYKNSWSLRQLGVKHFEQISVTFGLNDYYQKRMLANLCRLSSEETSAVFRQVYASIEKKSPEGLSMGEFTCFFMSVSKRLQTNSTN